MIEHVAIPAINQTFDAIGKTPLDPNRVKLKSYGERKFRQLQAGVRETSHSRELKLAQLVIVSATTMLDIVMMLS